MGVNSLASNPCNLLDFQYVSLADGATIAGQSGEREVLAVIMGGKATFTVGDVTFARVGGRAMPGRAGDAHIISVTSTSVMSTRPSWPHW